MKHSINRSINKLIFLSLSLVVLSSCATNPSKDQTNASYDITNLNLTQNSLDGEKEFTLSSPLASINVRDKITKTKEAEIIFYRNNKEKYLVKSDKSEIINNGDKIILFGNVAINDLSNDDITLLSSKLTWSKLTQKIVLKGPVTAKTTDSIITADSASYDQNNEIIYFYGNVNYKYYISDSNDINDIKTYETNSEAANLKVNSKLINFISRKGSVETVVELNRIKSSVDDYRR